MMDSEKAKIPELPPNWDRCHAYMENKRRYCRQQRRGTSLYCGNHSHLNSSNTNEANASTEGDTQTIERKRIPCPVDPSHLIYEDQVEKHVPICPKTKKRKREQAEQYFQKDINGGGFGDICTVIESNDHEAPKDEMERGKELALRILEVHRQLFSKEDATTSTGRLEDITFDDLHNSIEMRDYSEQELCAGITEGFQVHRIRSGGARHVPQLASLIGHLRMIGVLPKLGDVKASKEFTEKPLLLIDMGAGRGMLGLTAAGVSRSHGLETHLMMVERAGTRSKAEKILRNLGKDESSASGSSQTYLSFEDVQWSRVKCDLLHVNLKVLLEKPELKNCKVVIIAKHLCGVGSDLALKAIEPVRERIDACVFATCCHGVCNWCGYVGRDYLRRQMETGDNRIVFGPKEFDLLRQWCAGSVACQSRNAEDIDEAERTVDEEKVEGPQQEDVEDGEAEHSVPRELLRPSRTNISAVVESLNLKCGIAGLGRACQRLIDHGRLQYLRHNLFEGIDSAHLGLFHYVPPGTTPQNALLVATRMKAVS